MNDTEQLFVAAAVWSVIAVVIARFIPSWPGRIAFVAIAVGLPFWELPYGYYNFQKLCREEIALKVFDRIVPQDSVCADYPYVTLHRDLLRVGFTIVETRGNNGEITKYIRRSDGEIVGAAQQELASKYCLAFINNNQLPWRVVRHDQLIMRAHDRHVVARQSRFAWSGMWWQEDLRPVLGRGGECSSEKNDSILALRYGVG